MCIRDSDNGLQQRRICWSSHIPENITGIIQHHVYAYKLLENRQHNANKNHEETIRKPGHTFFVQGIFDFAECYSCIVLSWYFFQHGKSFLIPAFHHQESGCFGHKEQEQQKDARWNNTWEKHPAPAICYQPIFVAAPGNKDVYKRQLTMCLPALTD